MGYQEKENVMSQSRNFGAREFALCLVILANAVWLGATILNTAASAPTVLADVIEEDTIASFSLEKEDDSLVSVELTLAQSDDTPFYDETVITNTDGRSASVISLGLESLEAPYTPPKIESLLTTLVIPENLQGETIEIGGAPIEPQLPSEEEVSPEHSTSADSPDSIEQTNQSDRVVDEPGLVVKRHLETSQALLKADYEELRESGLDVLSALGYIDRMAADDRYGEFGR